MKKIMISIALLGALSCTKENSTKPVNSSNESDAKVLSAKITCANVAGNYYRVWYSLSNTRVNNGIWLLFSKDKQTISYFEKLKSIDGVNFIYTVHADEFGNTVKPGVGALYIMMGARPVRGNSLPNTIAVDSTISTNPDACPVTPIKVGPYDTIPAA